MLRLFIDMSFFFFLLFLQTTFEFVIPERPVKMSDQPKVCPDDDGHLGLFVYHYYLIFFIFQVSLLIKHYKPYMQV